MGARLGDEEDGQCELAQPEPVLPPPEALPPPPPPPDPPSPEAHPPDPPLPAAVPRRRRIEEGWPRLYLGPAGPHGPSGIRLSVGADGKTDMRAECGVCSATMTRTCRLPDRKTGQGRPLGLLAAWLLGGCASRDEHRKTRPGASHFAFRYFFWCSKLCGSLGSESLAFVYGRLKIVLSNHLGVDCCASQIKDD